MLILLLLFALFRLLRGSPTVATAGQSFDISAGCNLLPRDGIVFGTRTTSDIVASCLATIFACTWTAIHPNIPSPEDSRRDIFKRRLVTTTYALLAPEFISLWAYRQYIGAKNIMEDYNTEISKMTMIQRVSDSERSLAQRLCGSIKEGLAGRTSYHAIHEMNHNFRQAIFCEICDSSRDFCAGIKQAVFCAPPFVRTRKGEIQPWTTTHGFFIQMGGFMLCKDGIPIQTLDFTTLKDKIDGNVIKAPRITQAEIEDRSKGDAVSKTIVILQTTWFITQCIARWSTRLPVTELEILTLGFAMLNGITYALWWNKPQNVGVPVYIEEKVQLSTNSGNEGGSSASSQSAGDEAEVCIHLTSPDIQESGDFVPKELHDTRQSKKSFLLQKLTNDLPNSTWSKLMFSIPYRLILGVLRPLDKLTEANNEVHKGDLRVPIFFAEPVSPSDTGGMDVFVVVLATLFGCVHLVPAFSLHFSSPTEMGLWQITAAFITIEPCFSGLFMYALDPLQNYIPGWCIDTIGALIAASLPLYIIARVALIVLSFHSLRDLSVDTLRTIDWISSIPHL